MLACVSCEAYTMVYNIFKDSMIEHCGKFTSILPTPWHIKLSRKNENQIMHDKISPYSSISGRMEYRDEKKKGQQFF